MPACFVLRPNPEAGFVGRDLKRVEVTSIVVALRKGQLATNARVRRLIG